MKLKSPMFWVYLAINLYLISMLVFVSVQFFGGFDIGKISAFGSVLGGIGSLFAGFVAIYLFNDWKEQHNKQILASEAKDTFKMIHKERDSIHLLKFTCIDLSQGKSTKNVSWHSFTLDFENNLLSLFNINKDKMTSFCYLSEGQDAFNLMISYRKEIDKVAKILAIEKSKPFSQTTFLTQESGVWVLGLIKDIETKNGDLLDGLKTYIFVK